jgi:hypothetical protein
MKYIYHHLGLGDHIICNGLIRSLINNEDKFTLFVKPQNEISVRFMFRDLKNLDFIIGDDDYVNYYLMKHKVSNNKIIKAGFYFDPRALDFDDSFYLQNNVPFINRWEKFYCMRDLKREQFLFDYLNLEKDKYVFIHDDKSRNFEVDDKFIVNKDLKIVRPEFGLTSNLFDYCLVMQNSIESHFIDSSFRLAFDSLKLRESNIFYHINLKNGIIKDSKFKSQSFLNFKVI